MGKVEIEHGMAKYTTNGEIYYVKRHFTPSIIPGSISHRFLVHETFFSYGPIEKIVSLLGTGRVNVVSVKLASEMNLTGEDRERLTEIVGPEFYFSRAAYQYDRNTLPHQDSETAMGFQTVFDILVRNWDDGEKNIWQLSDVPIWFDFGASLDPRCQNIYRFLLKLQDSAEAGRVSTIKRYFENYSRQRNNILQQGIEVFKNIPLSEIRTIVRVAEANFAGFFAECLARNISQIEEDIDIIRGAFLPKELEAPDSLIFTSSLPKNNYWRQIK